MAGATAAMALARARAAVSLGMDMRMLVSWVEWTGISTAGRTYNRPTGRFNKVLRSQNV
jgi:hypothetical protein